MTASNSRVLYTGVCNDLIARIGEHKRGEADGFTAKYHVNRLVYAEVFRSIKDAIAREKQIKGWRRSKKVALIESANPAWDDLNPANIY